MQEKIQSWRELASLQSIKLRKPFREKGKEYRYRCFIACSFNDQHKDVIYEVTKTLKNKGIYVEMAKAVDGIDFLGRILRRIDECDFGIVDITDNHPNAMMELGLLMARQKPVILIRNKPVAIARGIEIPSNLNGIGRIDFVNTRVDLRRQLSDLIGSPGKDRKIQKPSKRS